jgi:archaellum biogenesis protein FlaJ (TadC family)
VKRLYARLNFRIGSNVAWRSFETEVDSQLIYRVNEVFTDVLYRGGNVNEVSKLIESMYFIYTNIRRRRYQIVSYLNGLLVPLHVAMCGMLAIVSGFFTSLSKFISYMPTILPLQTSLPIEFINMYFLFVLTLFSLNNAASIYSIEGDSHFTLIFFLGLMLSTGSLIYGLTFQLATGYLSSILTVQA